jgi:hypothetical protein
MEINVAHNRKYKAKKVMIFNTKFKIDEKSLRKHKKAFYDYTNGYFVYNLESNVS